MATTTHLPLILIRGFGGLDVDDERQVAYQGFNEGTVYPHKRGENYIYEGLVIKYLKSRWGYHDATNVVAYYANPVLEPPELPDELRSLDPGYFSGHRVIIDPGTALDLITAPEDPCRSLWVFRYYDLNERTFKLYGEALVRLIDFVRDLTAIKRNAAEKPAVNIIAHSMGGLIVREAVQVTLPGLGRGAVDCINKIVTLGTPHKGVSFQGVRDWKFTDAQEELERFNPKAQADPANEWAWVNFAKHFPPERVLCVVGTNYRTYGTRVATALNRLFSAPQEYGWKYNRSDGLVKQSSAQLPGSPRTFIHKCHGGYDSVVTARESFEVATRFFHGDVHARINLVSAHVKRGLDSFGKSEIFFGMSLKPRRVDFELFHQSAEAENCYGPFRTPDFTDSFSGEGFGWAGPDRLLYEGWFDTSRISPLAGGPVQPAEQRDLVIRLDFYVGERDSLGVGFSDNVIFRKQYYLRAVATGPENMGATALDSVQMYLYADESFAAGLAGQPLVFAGGRWVFSIGGTGFEAQLGIQLERVGAQTV